MAVRPREEEDEEEVEVESGVGVGIEGDKIEAEKERKVQRLGDPRRPTSAEIEDHNRTHLPYRN